MSEACSSQCLGGDGPGVYKQVDMEETYLLEEVQEHPEVSVLLLNSLSSVGKQKSSEVF